MFLQTGRQAKHVCLTLPTKGNHFHHRGAGSGQGTGFVKDNGVRMGHCLQVLSAFYRHMSSAGLPHSRKHRQRHGQFQRTGKIHHENGKRPGNISCQQIRQAASQQSIGYQCIRQMGSFVLRSRFEFSDCSNIATILSYRLLPFCWDTCMIHSPSSTTVPA